jgi:hypothetical protein
MDCYQLQPQCSVEEGKNSPGLPACAALPGARSRRITLSHAALLVVLVLNPVWSKVLVGILESEEKKPGARRGRCRWSSRVPHKSKGKKGRTFSLPEVST